MIRGYRANNISTVEFELTMEQINKICQPLIITKDETIVPINRHCSATSGKKNMSLKKEYERI